MDLRLNTLYIIVFVTPLVSERVGCDIKCFMQFYIFSVRFYVCWVTACSTHFSVFVKYLKIVSVKAIDETILHNICQYKI